VDVIVVARVRKFQTFSGGQNSVAGGRNCAAGRYLIGFDLDKGSTSTGKVGLGLGRVLVLV